MNRLRNYWRARWKQWLLLVCVLLLFVAADRLLKLYYYSKSYSHYEVGAVYWEDSKTALMFAPDRYLFWRYKPHIAIKLSNDIEQYSLYRIGTVPVRHAITVETNSRGYRGPEFSCAKAEGTFRIFVLGDSRSMAEGVTDEQRYSEQLERMLNATGAGPRYEVINMAVDGYSSYQGRVQVERELVHCEPDMITVMFGINDQDWDLDIRDEDRAATFDSPLVSFSQWTNRSMLLYFVRFQLLQLKGSLFGKTERVPTLATSAEGRNRRVTLEDYEHNLSRIAELGQRHGFIPVFLIVPNSPYSWYPELYENDPAVLPAEAEERFARIKSLLARRSYAEAAQNLEALLAEHPGWVSARHSLARCYQQLGRWEEAHRHFVMKNDQIVFSGYEAIVRKVAAEHAVPLIDLNAPFTEMRRELMYIDDMHPNDLGHRILVEALYAKIISLR